MSRNCLILVLAASFSLAVGGFLIACDKSPTRPTLPRRDAGPPPVFTNRIEITGPATVAPGQSVQLTALAHRSDGTSADVTSTATWLSNNARVLSITASGLATGHAMGDAIVSVMSGTSGSREMVVVSPGTYRLVGQIVDADSPTSPVIGAQIEALGGAPGLSTTTGFDGRYRLYGVPADLEIRVTKEGYASVAQRLSLSDHQTHNVALALLAPRANVAGIYTLTLNAAAECRDRLPQEVWSRRYTATITQTGPLLDVSLTGATFLVAGDKGNDFRGRVEPGRVQFTIDYGDFYYYKIWPDIVEQISSSMYFYVFGSVSAALTPGNVSGALDGSFFTVDSDPRRTFPAPNRSCRSAVHQFVLQQ